VRRGSKYRNHAVPAELSHDGRRYASKGEARRAQQLQLLERAGKIEKLEYQVRFPLVVLGVKICTYVADFRYR